MPKKPADARARSRTKAHPGKTGSKASKTRAARRPASAAARKGARKIAPAKRATKTSRVKKANRSKPNPQRLHPIAESELNPTQRELVAAIASGPRGKFSWGGPFAAWLHAPELGLIAQRLGAYCRYGTSLPPRLSEFAILVTAAHWRAQYEWHVHAPIAEKQGVAPATIADLRRERSPRRAPKDEHAVFAFLHELYHTKRVRTATYRTLEQIIGTQALVELVGLAGYYATVAMTLDAFEMALPDGAPLPFREAAR
jgi:4-carboxymuconolactone decarboxylase